MPIQVNQPTEYGGFWYFQSTWDPPAREVPGSGMNHTGLGVGNRNGVGVQLAGCGISVAGMIFAFYVKPVLRRSRWEQLRRERETAVGEDSLEEVGAVERSAARLPVIAGPPASPHETMSSENP
jgi:hypothetical protein